MGYPIPIPPGLIALFVALVKMSFVGSGGVRVGRGIAIR
jgi:hypothetical protein